MNLQSNRIIKRTLLSQKPQENSLLVAITSILVMLVASLFVWNGGRPLYLDWAAIPQEVFQEGEYWRLWTAILIHADFEHFLSNAVLFGLFAFLLYGYFGFWIFPVASYGIGALVNYVSLMTYPPQVRLVGASGVVYLMAACWLTMYMFVERRHSRKRRLLHVVGVALIVLVPSALQEVVSYRTHFFGFVAGILTGVVFFLLNRDQIREAEVVEYDIEEWEPEEQPEYYA